MTGNTLLVVCTWMPCHSDHIACVHLETNQALDDPRPSYSIRHRQSCCSPESTWDLPYNPARSMKLLWLPVPCSPRRSTNALLRCDTRSLLFTGTEAVRGCCSRTSYSGKLCAHREVCARVHYLLRATRCAWRDGGGWKTRQ
jgi:hypothetical protein